MLNIVILIFIQIVTIKFIINSQRIKSSIIIKLIQLIEVKSGDSYDGRLDQVDKFMNIQLLDVVHTSKVIISNNGYKGWK